MLVCMAALNVPAFGSALKQYNRNILVPRAYWAIARASQLPLYKQPGVLALWF